MPILYNRYIPNDAQYEQVREPAHAAGPFKQRRDAQRPPPPPTKGANPLDGIIGGLGGLLKNFHLEKLDSGDILLVLILLFLFLERDDNLELVITLGLLLVFGLFGNNEKSEDQSSPSPTV